MEKKPIQAYLVNFKYKLIKYFMMKEFTIYYLYTNLLKKGQFK